MNIRRSVLPLAALLVLSSQAGAADNAAIQEWARQKAGPNTRLLPEIQQKTADAQSGSALPIQAGNIVSAQTPTAAPAGAPKRATVCNSSGRLGDNTVFYCGAFGNERITVQSLSARGWRLVSV